MQFLITPRRSRGVALPMLPPKRTTVIRGDLTIANRVSDQLHRHSNVASVRAVNGSLNLLLPELYDASISAMTRDGFTVSGIQLEGDVWYEQSWWCLPII